MKIYQKRSESPYSGAIVEIDLKKISRRDKQIILLLNIKDRLWIKKIVMNY